MFRGRAVHYDYWGCLFYDVTGSEKSWRPLNRKYLLLTSAEVYNVTLDELIAAKWPMPPKICKLCTGKAKKPY